ncbi:MAG: VOC family protein [Acidobacteriia bacterium]|nr:VOC family protein [Terriglobia bacterium]
MAVSPIPKGYHSITPYLVVPGISKLIEFLKEAFGAVVTETPTTRPDGTVAHAEVKIGDSIVMMGEPMGQWKAMPCVLYLYVPDIDEVYRKALQAGAKSLQEPADQFYGDRNGGVVDPAGNMWWIGTHKEDVPPEEMAKRAEAAMKQRK